MTNKATGWTLFIAALGMMSGLMAGDIKQLSSWSDATTTMFIGTMMGHISVVIMAFIGGVLIPPKQNQREDDRKEVGE